MNKAIQRFVTAAAFFWLLLPQIAPSQEQPAAKDAFHEKVQAALDEIDREIKSGQVKGGGPADGLRQQLRFIEQIRAQQDDHVLEFHLQALRDQSAQVSPGIAKACGELLDFARAESQKRAQERAQSVDAALQGAATSIRQAKKATDLTSAILKLQATNSEGRRSSRPTDAELNQKLNTALELTKNWQQALAAFEQGDMSSASDRVRSTTLNAPLAFGPAFPPDFFEQTAHNWEGYWRNYVEQALAAARQNLLAAKTPAEALRVNDSLTELQRMRFGPAISPELSRRLNEANNQARTWSDFLRNVEDGQPQNALSVLDSVSRAQGGEALISRDEVKVRRDAIFAEAAKKAEAALQTIARRLAEARTPDELEGIDTELNPIQDILGRRRQDYGNLVAKMGRVRTLVSSWRSVLTAQNQKDAGGMENRLREIETMNAGLGIISPQLIEEKHKAAAAIAGVPVGQPGDEEAWIAALPNRIASIARASDATTLDAEVRARQKVLRDPQASFRDDLFQLQNDLAALAQFIASCEQGSFDFSYVRQGEPYRHRWQKETGEVRAKFARQTLAAILKEPRITQSQVDIAGLQKAVLEIADDAARRKDWQKVYDALRVCAGGDGRVGATPVFQEMHAIASFFAGQRFEQAQQWVEAVRSYQDVLRQMGERIPTAEATKRLQELGRSHPDAVAQASTQPRNGFSR